MIKNKINITECDASAVLTRQNLEKLLKKLPIAFYTAQKGVNPNVSYAYHKRGEMEVVHSAAVISIYPKKGEYLSNATLLDRDFPIRPDNIMDDQLGLRSCFHPKLSSFGLESSTARGITDDEVEIDVHKFPRGEEYSYTNKND